jgi:hypothetical protein
MDKNTGDNGKIIKNMEKENIPGPMGILTMEDINLIKERVMEWWVMRMEIHMRVSGLMGLSMGKAFIELPEKIFLGHGKMENLLNISQNDTYFYIRYLIIK